VGITGFCAYLVVTRQPVLAYLDVLASSLALGPAIARWGCFINGCCFGKTSTVVWAVRFPRYSFVYESHLESGLIEPSAYLSHPVHPVQIYASMAGLLLFVVMSRFWHTYRHRTGLTFAAYWMIYCSIRFGMEFFRGDVPHFPVLQMTLSQHVCVILLIIASIGFYRRLVITRHSG
jgi:phosphatidylglycerol:prolipoprotein diacylglycerol transferase